MIINFRIKTYDVRAIILTSNKSLIFYHDLSDEVKQDEFIDIENFWAQFDVKQIYVNFNESQII